MPYITFVCYRKFEKRTEERWLSSLTLFYKRMDGTTNLEGFKKSWPCLKLIFSCSKEAIHFQFSFLPMHPSCQKSSVNCSLRSFEGRWLACVPDEDRFWFRYCNTLLFVSLLWHFYETCHAKTLNFLIMWKKLVNSKDLHGKKTIKIIHSVAALMFAKRQQQLSNRSNFHLLDIILLCENYPLL